MQKSTSHFLASDTDPRSLIVRVLAAAQAIATIGLKPDEVIDFLHCSFDAFLERQSVATWQWDRAHLDKLIRELEMHGLVAKAAERYILTPLGRLAGEAGVEVESIVRLVDAVQTVSPDDLSDPTLIAATQLTVELDQELFPLNKMSTQKEPQTWHNVLHEQGVSPLVLSRLSYYAKDRHQPTLRAKKAVACLYWITDTPLSQIEASLTQFGRAFGGAAGPIRAVSTRTADLLETVFRVAELPHKGLDLSERRTRLLTRLQVGVPGKCVEIARILGNNLTRGDYQSLLRADLATVGTLEGASDSDLTRVLGSNSEALRKTVVVRDLLREHRMRPRVMAFPTPLPQYTP